MHTKTLKLKLKTMKIKIAEYLDEKTNEKE